MHRHLMIWAIVAGSALAIGCGGSEPEPKTAAKVAVPPMEQLKNISAELKAGAADLTKPIDQLQAILDSLALLPERHGLTLADVLGMASATLQSGKVTLNANVDVSAAAKEELETLLARLNELVIELKRTPEKVATLTKKIAEDTALVPVLAGQVTFLASTTAMNPFVAAEVRAKAQADAADLQRIQKEVTDTISETENKVMGVPAMATNALAKLEASLMGGLDTGSLQAQAHATGTAKLTGN